MASICCSPPDSVPAAWPRALCKLWKQREHALKVLRLIGARPRQHRAHLEILQYGERRKHLAAFGHLADAEIADPVRFQSADAFVAQHDAALRRAQHAGDGADERGLAGAVGADDRDDRALRDFNRHAVERADVAVGHFKVLNGEHHTASAPR